MTKTLSLPACSALDKIAVLNRMLTDNTLIKLTNDSTNASLIIWLAPAENAYLTDGETLFATGIEVKPGHSADIKPSELGNLNYTFLQIKNISEVNEASYHVEVVG